MALINISVDISPKEKGPAFGPFICLIQLTHLFDKVLLENYLIKRANFSLNTFYNPWC